MTALRSDFDSGFKDLTGYDPLPWQRRLDGSATSRQTICYGGPLAHGTGQDSGRGNRGPGPEARSAGGVGACLPAEPAADGRSRNERLQ